MQIGSSTGTLNSMSGEIQGLGKSHEMPLSPLVYLEIGRLKIYH